MVRADAFYWTTAQDLHHFVADPDPTFHFWYGFVSGYSKKKSIVQTRKKQLLIV